MTAAAASAGCGSATAATTPTARLCHTESGAATGKGVMLLHGWACDSHDWS
ncbi:hypothetical protein [Cystobacter ferrugineus]|uniref:hypothetical protein n=1 Tax=Cystobacter ferrugineus TaxID=83449 RepID=UPI000A468C15|nr:hypothetical protein [Cystobacter ferrugineus]